MVAPQPPPSRPTRSSFQTIRVSPAPKRGDFSPVRITVRKMDKDVMFLVCPVDANCCLVGNSRQNFRPFWEVGLCRKERIFNPHSLRLEIQAPTNFLCSNKIEILNLNAAGPRESKEPGIYEWTRLSLDWAVSEAGYIEIANGRSRVGEGRAGGRQPGPQFYPSCGRTARCPAKSVPTNS
jgi:hypothetical protein